MDLKLNLTILRPCATRAETLRRGVAGLRSVTDEGDALLEALEAIAAAAERGRVTDRAVRAAYETTGTVQGAARVLGVARSTVRDRLAKMTAPGPRLASDARGVTGYVVVGRGADVGLRGDEGDD